MQDIIQKLSELYVESTESKIVQVRASSTRITILIISDWFISHTREERLDYLVEGLQVFYPDLIKTHKIHFQVLTLQEAFGQSSQIAS